MRLSRDPRSEIARRGDAWNGIGVVATHDAAQALPWATDLSSPGNRFSVGYPATTFLT